MALLEFYGLLAAALVGIGSFMALTVLSADRKEPVPRSWSIGLHAIGYLAWGTGSILAGLFFGPWIGMAMLVSVLVIDAAFLLWPRWAGAALKS